MINQTVEAIDKVLRNLEAIRMNRCYGDSLSEAAEEGAINLLWLKGRLQSESGQPVVLQPAQSVHAGEISGFDLLAFPSPALKGETGGDEPHPSIT